MFSVWLQRNLVLGPKSQETGRRRRNVNLVLSLFDPWHSRTYQRSMFSGRPPNEPVRWPG